MKRLFIIGAGGFGREVYAWLKQCPDWETRWQFAGFLDDNAMALASFPHALGVVGKIDDCAPLQGDEFVCAIGDPRSRLRICRNLAGRGAIFPVIRHPFSVVGEDCRLGVGCIVCPGAIITTNVTLGEFVVVNICATIGHDAKVGDGATLSPHADVNGCAEIGEGAFLGSHAVVIPSGRVGAFARVGAGSVVLRSIAPGVTAVGVPARQIIR